MPAELVLIFGLVLLFVGAIFTVALILEENKQFYIPLLFSVIGAVLLTWFNSAQSKIVNLNLGSFKVSVVNNVAVITVNDRPVNLNKDAGRNFTNGEVVTISKPSVYSEGLYFEGNANALIIGESNGLDKDTADKRE